MEEDKIQIELEGVLTVRVNGELKAVVANDLNKKAQIFSECKEMGVDSIKSLLEVIAEGKIPKQKI